MPIYEYQCKACANKHEALQKMADEPLTICPACDQPALEKLVSAAGFRLSGGGWYETDFKSNNQKNLAGDAKAKPSDGLSTKKTSSDTGKTQSSSKNQPAAS